MANILIVDDNEVALNILAHMLRKENHLVVGAKDGLDALDKYSKAVFDIIITDLDMPNLNGLDLIKRLRNKLPRRSFGVIFISVTDVEASVMDAFDIGADDFMQKPISSAELLMRVQRLLAKKAAGKL